MNNSLWELVVGNVGTVLSTKNGAFAMREYGEYKQISIKGIGRAGNEEVTLFRDGDIYWEHTPLEYVLEGKIYEQRFDK